MKRTIACMIALCLVLVAAALMAAEGDKKDKDKGKDREQAAVAAATTWLGLVDDGKFGESYTEAAVYFKNAITKEAWEKALGSVRTPLGAMVSRKVKGTTFKTELPGAPDGEYVIIQFTTSFKNKKEAVETITPMKEKDGTWRVSGYYIK